MDYKNYKKRENMQMLTWLQLTTNKQKMHKI